MLQRFPLMSRFAAKLFGELLPAAIASAIGATLLGQLAAQSTKPAAKPTVIAAGIAADKVIKVVRTDYVPTIEFATAELKSQIKPSAVHVKVAAVRKPKPAEPRVVAAAPTPLAPEIVGEPLALVAAAPPVEHHTLMGRLRGAKDAVLGWLMDGTPPRPPLPLPEARFFDTSM
jgi:hypothetical protein